MSFTNLVESMSVWDNKKSSQLFFILLYFLSNDNDSYKRKNDELAMQYKQLRI